MTMDIKSSYRRPRPGRLVALGLSLLFVLAGRGLMAQGPSVSYYYHPQTELSWAGCYLHLEGGSRQKIPFLPVICSSFRHAPLGIGNYAKDVAVDGPVIFAGNGIVNSGVWDSYSGRRADYTTGAIDAAGGIVVFSWDGTDSIETKYGREFPLARRIADAAARKAAAVVVFSWSKEFPFPAVQYEKPNDIPDIPVIVVTKSSITSILAAAGVDGDEGLKSWAESGTPPQSQALIARLSIDLRGRFEAVETGNFLFRFLGGSFPGKEMDDLAQVNEKSLTLLKTIFDADRGLAWEKLPVHYFRDYDTKVFYTHHWGLGWATDEGTYMVHPGGAPNFPLVVHENAHILIGANWGGSSSFLSEGIGRCAEAEAGDRDENDRQTIGYLKEGKLFRLRDMLSFDIGKPGLETDVGYPVAGSFVGFLIRTRGLKTFKEIYLLVAPTEDGGKSDAIWLKAAGKSLGDLEREWLGWLARNHPEDAAAIRAHLIHS
jgi:hypothetical protein